ncbi:MAG: O-acetyl-ADP-ribose deacetylase [Clostridia bacterium]|nr:O-acetyl-ADP-ribose deacetylase [Clostridia bacterium]
MPLHLIREDITKMKTDAVVNAANNTLLGGGGVDGAIHAAAGPKLLKECRKLGGCETGRAKITKGYDMPCKYIIHTVGPVWQGGGYGEEGLLCSCYSNSLKLAEENGCESVAFPLISSGVYGYPKKQALEIATKAITAFLESSDMTVYLVIFDKRAIEVTSSVYGEIEQRINDFYVEQRELEDRRYHRNAMYNAPLFDDAFAEAPIYQAQACAPLTEPEKEKKPKLPKIKKEKKKKPTDYDIHTGPAGNQEMLYEAAPAAGMAFELDESFSEMLLRKIDEKGITDAECYKKANVDRRLFSKIRSNAQYKPSKQTAIAFAIALELPEREIDEMLRKAGYALSGSVLFDVIIKACIEKGEYNIFKINEILFEYDQQILC